MPQLVELRGDLVYSVAIPPTAAGTAVEAPLVQLPFPALITEIKWIPGAAMAFNGTNFVTLTVRNRQTGAGVIVPATRTWSAVSSVSTTPETLTLSGTASDLQLAANDVVTAHWTHSGTGLAIPAGLLQVKLRSR